MLGHLLFGRSLLGLNCELLLRSLFLGGLVLVSLLLSIVVEHLAVRYFVRPIRSSRCGLRLFHLRALSHWGVQELLGGGESILRLSQERVLRYSFLRSSIKSHRFPLHSSDLLVHRELFSSFLLLLYFLRGWDSTLSGSSECFSALLSFLHSFKVFIHSRDYFLSFR